MATAKQIAANRRNSLKSCGPKSAETKAIVSKNRLKHGLCGEFGVLSFEEQSKYEELLAQFIEDEKPVGSVERELVVKMARHTWMSHRAIRLQDACFLIEPQTPEQKISGDNGVAVRFDLDVYVRYQIQNDRAYQRASQELIQRRKERLKAEIGFERKQRGEAQEKRRERRENRFEQSHHAAAARASEKLTQMKLQTALLERKLTRSHALEKSISNSDSATYTPAAA